jgi:hypothetical protein
MGDRESCLCKTRQINRTDGRNPVLAECREKARRTIEGRPTSRTAAAVIVALWLSLATLASLFVARVT